MSDAFKILATFLDRMEQEVEGRTAVDLPDEVRQQLRQFAEGSLDPGLREELVRKLVENRDWEEGLARAIKEIREGDRESE